MYFLTPYQCTYRTNRARMKMLKNTRKGFKIMYRLQVWFDRHWKWGLNDYTLEQAKQRVEELKAHGIKARVRPSAELFN